MLKKIFRSIAVAFSIYSRIPMPQFIWNSDDMKYDMIFFPWVGGVIGAVMLAWYKFSNYIGAGHIGQAMILVAIPLIITGGFHFDGFMDTEDALRSYKGKEERLKIMEDPHIGAFAVIGAFVYILILTGTMSMISSDKGFYIIFCSFFLVRCLSGILTQMLKSAKSSGMLKETKDISGKIVKVFLFIQFVTAIIIMAYISISFTAGVVIALLSYVIIFKYRSYKLFGGVTGDLLGRFLCIGELLVVICVFLIENILKLIKIY